MCTQITWGSICMIFYKVFLLPSGLRFFAVNFCRNIQKWWLEESAWCQFFLHSCIVAFYKERLIITEFLKQREQQCKGWLDYNSRRKHLTQGYKRICYFCHIWLFKIWGVSFLQRIHLSHSQKPSNLVFHMLTSFL